MRIYVISRHTLGQGKAARLFRLLSFQLGLRLWSCTCKLEIGRLLSTRARRAVRPHAYAVVRHKCHFRGTKNALRDCVDRAALSLLRETLSAVGHVTAHTHEILRPCSCELCMLGKPHEPSHAAARGASRPSALNKDGCANQTGHFFSKATHPEVQCPSAKPAPVCAVIFDQGLSNSRHTCQQVKPESPATGLLTHYA